MADPTMYASLLTDVRNSTKANLVGYSKAMTRTPSIVMARPRTPKMSSRPVRPATRIVCPASQSSRERGVVGDDHSGILRRRRRPRSGSGLRRRVAIRSGARSQQDRRRERRSPGRSGEPSWMHHSSGGSSCDAGTSVVIERVNDGVIEGVKTVRDRWRSGSHGAHSSLGP